MFAILSRLEDDSESVISMTKLRIYNGEEVVEKGKTTKMSAQRAPWRTRNAKECSVSRLALS